MQCPSRGSAACPAAPAGQNHPAMWQWQSVKAHLSPSTSLVWCSVRTYRYSAFAFRDHPKPFGSAMPNRARILIIVGDFAEDYEVRSGVGVAQRNSGRELQECREPHRCPGHPKVLSYAGRCEHRPRRAAIKTARLMAAGCAAAAALSASSPTQPSRTACPRVSCWQPCAITNPPGCIALNSSHYASPQVMVPFQALLMLGFQVHTVPGMSWMGGASWLFRRVAWHHMPMALSWEAGCWLRSAVD